MGAPILLGGAQFQINQGSLPLDERQSGVLLRNADPAACVVLSEVAAGFHDHGYETTKPKRGKADDVRVRCIRGDRYIELILISEPHSEGASEFSLDAWGYTKVHSPSVYNEIADEWRQLVTVIDGVLRNRFNAASTRWLSPKEVDARYAAKGNP